MVIQKYNIIKNGKHVECGLLGITTAKAHARKYCSDLFDPNAQIEILNLTTAEITIIQKGVKLRQ